MKGSTTSNPSRYQNQESLQTSLYHQYKIWAHTSYMSICFKNSYIFCSGVDGVAPPQMPHQKNIYILYSSLKPVNVILSIKNTSANAITSFKITSSFKSGGTKSKRQIWERKPRGDEGRHWSNVCTSQDMPRIAGRNQKQEAQKGFPHRASKRNQAWLLTPWFQTSAIQNCKRINFCCLNPPSLG